MCFLIPKTPLQPAFNQPKPNIRKNKLCVHTLMQKSGHSTDLMGKKDGDKWPEVHIEVTQNDNWIGPISWIRAQKARHNRWRARIWHM